MSGRGKPQKQKSDADHHRQRSQQRVQQEPQLQPVPRDPWCLAASHQGQGGHGRPITGSAHVDQPGAPSQQSFLQTGMQTGLNQPPGLVGLPSAASLSGQDPNLSFFSDTQLNPGIIQPPQRITNPIQTPPGEAVMQPEDQGQMLYTQDLGLSSLANPDTASTAGSRRQNPTGQSAESIVSTESKKMRFAKEREQRLQIRAEFEEKKADEQRAHHYFHPNTMHLILLAIPSLGKGFEHILGSTPKVGNLINHLNQEGFMRAVPFDMPMMLPVDESSGISKKATTHASLTSLASTTSSTPSLTPSQREIFGMPDETQWPLGSKKSLYESGDTESVLDLEEEEEFLIRRLEKVRIAKYRRMEERRNKAELERTCQKKKYFCDDDRRSDGSTGTTV